MIVLPRHYGALIRILQTCTDQTMSAALERMDLTAAQGHIMGYLAHAEQPPCCRDIEEAFHLTHPTVSGILSRLEKKHFIQQAADPQDRRRRRVLILPKGRECHALIHQTILDTEQQIVRGFSPQEQEQFLSYLERAICNMGVCPEHYHHKEEANE